MIEVIAGWVELIVKSLVVKHGDNLPETSRNFFKRIGWFPLEFQDELKKVLTISLTKVFDEYPVLAELNLSDTVVAPLLTPIVEYALYEVQLPDFNTLKAEFDRVKEYEWELKSLENSRDLNVEKFLESFDNHLYEAITATMDMSHRAIILHVRKEINQLRKLINSLIQSIITQQPLQTTTPKVTLSPPVLFSDFVQRHEIFDRLKSYLLQQPTNGTQQPVATTVLLEGGGGFGKTTLATAICDNSDIKDAYTDGIFWVELGQKPNLQELMNNLHNALAPQPTSFRDPSDVQNAIRTLLATKKILLIVDNVWNGNDAKWFTDANLTGANIITTRKTDLVMGEHRLNVDEMLAHEALELLTSYIQDDTFQTEFERLAQRLGYWALMLRLGNGLIRQYINRRGGTLKRAIDWLNDQLDQRGIISLQREEGEKHHWSADACIEISFEIFEDEKERKRVRRQYQELGIFPPGANIPFSALNAVWKVRKFDTPVVEEIVKTLDSLSLIRWDVSTNTISLHDIFREYASIRLEKKLPKTHRRLVKNYGDLHNLPDDYAWRNIGYHLTSANQPNQLRELLLSYGWLDKKLHATDTNALLGDYALLLAHGKDEPIHLIQSALSMSAHVLVNDKRALAHQLAGRLMHYYTKMDEIRMFLDVVMTTPNNLFPVNPASEYEIMNPAGGMLKRIFEHERVVGVSKFDNNRILSWGHDKTLRLWELNGKVKIFQGHLDNIIGVILLKDGRFISWGQDRILCLWGHGEQPETVFKGHNHIVLGAIELPDDRILSWSSDGTLKIWDMSGDCLETLYGHGSSINGSFLISDYELISWGHGLEKSLFLWNLKYNLSIELQGHSCLVINGAMQLPNGFIISWGKILLGQGGDLCLWSRDGKLYKRLTAYPNGGTKGVLLISSQDRFITWGDHAMSQTNSHIIMWDIDGNQIEILKEHTRDINGALNLSNGQFITWSDDGVLCIWNLDGNLSRKLKGHSSSVEGALLTSDENILSWSDDKTLIFWDVNGDNPKIFSGHSEIVYGAVEISDSYLLSWSRDNNLILWDKTESPIQVHKVHDDPIKGLLVLSDERILSWADNMLLFWRADLSVSPLLIKGIVSVDGVLELQQGVFLIWVSINSQTVYGSVYLLNINTGEFKDITSHQASIWGVNLLPDGRILSWGANRVAYLSSIEGELLKPLTHYASVSRVMPLLNGNLLSLDMAGRLYLWDKVGNPIIEIGTHSDNHESISGLYGMKELKDGRILSWGADKTIRIWTLESKDIPPLILRGHTGGVNGALFLSDERIISWSYGIYGDKTFRLWNKEGELLDILDEDYEYGNRENIFSWAIRHQFDPTELYPQDGSIDKFRIGKQGETLLVYSPQTGETIHKFYSDAMFSIDPVVISSSPYRVGIGNTQGQVVFLRWVGEEGS